MLERVLEAAKYIAHRYKAEYGQSIDEMKLHKLLYFAQRESLIQTAQPLFSESFVGWKFGPVMLPIRSAYKHGLLEKSQYNINCDENFSKIMDKIFSDYAPKEAWSLSRLTHGEFSWQQSRRGIKPGENGTTLMRLEDIKKDAERIKIRRTVLSDVAAYSRAGEK